MMIGQSPFVQGPTGVGSSSGVTLTASGAANTKGSYAALAVSTTYAASGIEVTLLNGSAAGRYAVDIAIGGAGSEQIILPDLHFACGNTICTVYRQFFPIPVKAGSRIAARVACSAGGATVEAQVQMHTMCAPGPTCGLWATHGFESADTSGIQVDPGAAANTKGAYSQLVASTTYPIHALVVDVTHQGNTVPSVCNWLHDIAIGGAGSEVVLVSNITDFATSNARLPGIVTVGPFAVEIPAGTRIAARSQCSITDATDRLVDFVIHGGARCQ